MKNSAKLKFKKHKSATLQKIAEKVGVTHDPTQPDPRMDPTRVELCDIPT